MLKLAMFGLDMADRTSRALSANSQAALDIQGLNAQIANQKKQKLQADETLYAQLDVAQDDYEYSTDEVFDKVQKVKEKAEDARDVNIQGFKHSGQFEQTLYEATEQADQDTLSGMRAANRRFDRMVASAHQQNEQAQAMADEKIAQYKREIQSKRKGKGFLRNFFAG